MAKKNKHVMVNLEPVLFEAFSSLVTREAVSTDRRAALGSKVRKLIIAELISKGVVTTEMLEECL